jgi:hypothetical protein
MKRAIIRILGVLSFSVLLYSCKKDKTVEPDTTTNNYLKVAEAVSANSSYSIEMWAADSLFVGYNKLYFRIISKSTGQVYNQATITLHPLMDMVTFSHACPVENPQGTTDAAGYFEGAILFSMPGTDSWTVDIDVVAGGVTESAHLALHKVSGTTPAKKIVVIDSLETSPGIWKITKYPISLIPPLSWKVGLNKFEITIHKMESMMSFPPVTDLTVGITPEMPSMGHGSPNNTDPVHTGNGHYVGTVNFTMTGDWRIHLSIKSGDRLISDKSYFDILF